MKLIYDREAIAVIVAFFFGGFLGGACGAVALRVMEKWFF